MHDFQAISILGSGLIALVVAWAMAVGMVPTPLASPNARSLHTHPVPRIGGVAIWAGWMLAWTTVPVAAQWVVPFAIVVAVSLIDDLRGLSATARSG